MPFRTSLTIFTRKIARNQALNFYFCANSKISVLISSKIFSFSFPSKNETPRGQADEVSFRESLLGACSSNAASREVFAGSRIRVHRYGKNRLCFFRTKRRPHQTCQTIWRRKTNCYRPYAQGTKEGNSAKRNFKSY